MNIPQVYGNEVKRLAYLTTWPINARVNPGDIGFLRNHSLEKKRTITDVGIDPKIEESDAGTIDLVSRGVSCNSMEANLSSADEFPLPNAEWEIRCAKDHTVILSATGCKLRSLSSDCVKDLEERIIQINANGGWDKRLAVVRDVVTAEGFCLLVLEGSNASMTLVADARASLPFLDLPGIGVSGTVIKARGLAYKQVLPRDASTFTTPLFRAYRLKGMFSPELRTIPAFTSTEDPHQLRLRLAWYEEPET